MKEFEVLAVWLVFLLFWVFYFCVCLWFLLVSFYFVFFFRVFCLLGILCTIKKVYGFVGNFPKFTLRQMSIRKFPWPNRLTKQIPQKDIWDISTQQALFILWWYCLWSCMDHLLLSFPGEPWEPRLSFVLQDAGSHPGNGIWGLSAVHSHSCLPVCPEQTLGSPAGIFQTSPGLLTMHKL